MLVSQNPLYFGATDDNVAQTRDVMDFWRPTIVQRLMFTSIHSTKQWPGQFEDNLK